MPNALTKTPKKPWPAVPVIDIVVRRGALRRFQLLKDKTAQLPVNVMWDRRQQDRRRVPAPTSVDLRTADRRQSSSFTWTLADFVVAAHAEVEGILLTSPRQSDVGGSEPEQPAPTAVRQQVSELNKELEAAGRKFERLQTALARQEELEQLLKQGRVHLQDLRSGLQQMTAERDRLQATLNESVAAHQLELDPLRKENDAVHKHFAAATIERDGLASRLEEREREMLSKEEEHRRHFTRVTTERDRLATEIAAHTAAHEQYVLERSEERATFERLLAEARVNQRDIMQELDEQIQQNKILRDAAIRAQALVRKIIDAHEPVPPETGGRK